MLKAIQITTTGQYAELDLSLDELEQLQSAVGGYVQPIDLTQNLTMWCNEEGKLTGLAHNPYAQFMWDEVFGCHTDYLVGDVVMTGGTDDEGETIGLTEEQVAILVNTINTVCDFVEPRSTVISWKDQQRIVYLT